ncbi:MAG: Thioesterase superfamily [Bacteroidetes bacterium]|nr:Thioesterase superfamily [Bacteroidota bacterium]
MKTYTQQHLITVSETAAAMGSGSLEVFATPAMIALMENTAIQTIDDLETGFTTVGIEINVQHLRASKPGETVTCTAELVKHEGKLYEFQIVVENTKGDKTGTATHKRVAVRIEKFMNSL